jgi:hypothetical protein
MHGAGELGGNPSKKNRMLTTRGLYLSALGYRESQAAYTAQFVSCRSTQPFYGCISLPCARGCDLLLDELQRNAPFPRGLPLQI